ncbi:related to microsomal signal peptidase 12 kDa subunit [Fusarium torulosum]|uniref:Signal peptidase complex subunit 1 n=1 Tax=Fusarium torulosum TaxID=33205 RepID=A0AAE8MIP2_9HYPO|nr:related to microsomal signal peptidase 12 kDa subunit [Fusarium torulosum]
MADQALDQIRDIADGQIDFEGQKLAELLATVLLVVSGLVSVVVGYILQDIKLAVYLGLGGTALTFLVVVPAWPFYKKHPVKWLPAGYAYDLASKGNQ